MPVNPGIRLRRVQLSVHVLDDTVLLTMYENGEPILDRGVPLRVARALMQLMVAAGIAPGDEPVVDLSRWAVPPPE